jgi:hypothetical protein
MVEVPTSEVVRRLDGLEEKLDRVSEAMLTLVRVEERQIQTAQTLDRVWRAVEEHDKRLSSVETKYNTQIAGNFSKQAMWGVIVLLTGVIGYLVQIK